MLTQNLSVFVFHQHHGAAVRCFRILPSLPEQHLFAVKVHLLPLLPSLLESRLPAASALLHQLMYILAAMVLMLLLCLCSSGMSNLIYFPYQRGDSLEYVTLSPQLAQSMLSLHTTDQCALCPSVLHRHGYALCCHLVAAVKRPLPTVASKRLA
jgi:hypothetical protein